jgi:hypothetical protein
MSKLTKAQAKKLAEQIYERFGDEISEDAERSFVPPSLVAGFIGSEAGKDRSGQIVPGATRFEPHVFRHLQSLRDNGRTTNGKNNYNGILQKHLADASDAALRALATSYNLTQIMGWWMLVGRIRDYWKVNPRLDGTIKQLRDDEYHLEYAVILLEQSAGRYIKKGDFASVCRIWNTGSPTGKTYHAAYVDNILAVKSAYEEIAGDDLPAATFNEEFDGSDADSLIETVSDSAPASTETSVTVVDGDVKVETSNAPPPPQEKIAIEKPAPKNFLEGIRNKIAALTGGNLTIQAIQDWSQQAQFLGLSARFWFGVTVIAAVGTGIYLIAAFYKHRSDETRNRQITNQLIQANTTPHNIVELIDSNKLSEYEQKGYRIIKR